MHCTNYMTAFSRRWAFSLVAILSFTHHMGAPAFGDFISASLGPPTIDPSNSQVMMTSLYVTVSFDDLWYDVNIWNVPPTALPGQTLTFTVDPLFILSTASLHRYADGKASSFGPMLMGTFRQTQASGDNLPTTLAGTVFLAVAYRNGASPVTRFTYQLDVWPSVPEPASITLGTTAVLGVGGLLIYRRRRRMPA